MEFLVRREIITVQSVVAAPTVVALLLDSIATAATTAWSTRKLRAAYAGSCMRVRRTSDNGELDIGFDGDALDTASLLSHVGASNGVLPTWHDQSGNSRNLTQATAERQPQIVSSGVLIDIINGNPTLLQLDTGMDDGLLSASIDAGTATVMLIVRPTVVSGANITVNPAISDSDGTFGLGFGNDTFGAFNNDGTLDLAVAGAASVNTNYVVAGRHGGGNLEAWINGGSGASTASGDTSNLASTLRFPAAFGISTYDGYVMEGILYDQALSNANINTLGANMAAYAGTTWTPI